MQMPFAYAKRLCKMRKGRTILAITFGEATAIDAGADEKELCNRASQQRHAIAERPSGWTDAECLLAC